MINTWIARIILSPFALLYWIIIQIRNFLYEVGLLKSIKFDIPIVSVGNLNTGGSGKTPMIEYLIRHLNNYIDVGVLSRGYKRNTKGYLEVLPDSPYKSVGDEPLFLKKKYPHIPVTVGEERALAIPQMLQNHEELKAILLDDAYQHRGVNPYINILLTDYNSRFTKDYILPMGRLREPRSSKSRADAIVVTKCPPDLSLAEQEKIKNEIAPLDHQVLMFSSLVYHTAYNIFNNTERILLNDQAVFLMTGIANPQPIIDYLSEKNVTFFHRKFADHHAFTKHDIATVVDSYQKMEGQKKIFLTTEKDLIRIEPHFDYFLKHKIVIFALPIEVRFLNNPDVFLDWVKEKMTNFKV
ncbi:tetraacyldisaccharide 4'-kinase [Membranihabitans marinus]|uniref:tetraacyldisaccharide 4'-kinase n=1 Tax=Membranihabitans marinus TaxID=1227546 RepID=UPI001F003EF9|nr:tetraacyldisaccharide 4'-kinase [Membranihabitans marinus]